MQMDGPVLGQRSKVAIDGLEAVEPERGFHRAGRTVIDATVPGRPRIERTAGSTGNLTPVDGEYGNVVRWRAHRYTSSLGADRPS
jgi:hypothetical protein